MMVFPLIVKGFISLASIIVRVQGIIKDYPFSSIIIIIGLIDRYLTHFIPIFSFKKEIEVGILVVLGLSILIRKYSRSNY